MPQTLLNDKLWLKLKPIILDLNIYDKPNLRNIFTGILYRLKTGCPWRYLPECPRKGGKTYQQMTDHEKSIDEKARLIVSEELGHGREYVTRVYLGR